MIAIPTLGRHKVFTANRRWHTDNAAPTGRRHTPPPPMKAVTFLAALACILKVSHEFPFNFNKRNLDSLARTGQLPDNKRSLASLAKSGQLPEKLVQEKRMLDVLEQASDANSKAIHEQRNRVVEEIQKLIESGMVKRELPAMVSEPDFRDKFKSELRATLNQYLKKFGTPYDQEKVELFLTNAADEVFDNHGIVSLDHIQFLIETGYFQQERHDGDVDDNEDDDYAKSADENYSPDDYYVTKRFMASLARNSNMPYWYNHPRNMDKRYISSLLRQGVLPYGFQPTTESSVKNSGWKNVQNGQMSKKSNMAYQNEEEFIPVMQGSKSLQNIIDDLTQEPMQKRYLGALSRSGWMPRGFASSSAFRHSPVARGSTGYGKRHLAALARLGWLPSFRNPHSFYMRNGRGSSFQCDINKRTSIIGDDNDDDADGYVENIGRSREEFGIVARPSTATKQTQTDGMKAKRYLLLPAVDNILLRKQYPHLATNKI